jgi:hypothetical protein
MKLIYAKPFLFPIRDCGAAGATRSIRQGATRRRGTRFTDQNSVAAGRSAPWSEHEPDQDIGPCTKLRPSFFDPVHDLNLPISIHFTFLRFQSISSLISSLVLLSAGLTRSAVSLPSYSGGIGILGDGVQGWLVALLSGRYGSDSGQGHFQEQEHLFRIEFPSRNKLLQIERLKLLL